MEQQIQTIIDPALQLETAGPCDIAIGSPPANTQNPLFGLCQPVQRQIPLANSHGQNKLAATRIIEIDGIVCDPGRQADGPLVSQLRSSVRAPWGQLLVPIFVSKLPTPTDGKLWLLRDGFNRLRAAEEIGLANILATVLEGTEEQIGLLVNEANMIRKHRSPYQRMKELADWLHLLQQTHIEYNAGGNKQRNTAGKKAEGLPPLETMIQQVSGLKKSAFFGKVAAYQSLEPTVVRPYLDRHPHCATASKDVWLRRLAKYSQEEQKQLAPFLKKLGNPQDAYFQSEREEISQIATSLPEDEMFPIYHESFAENAKRIADGGVGLIATDPNWHLAEDNEKGETWDLHGLPIAPQMTADTWHEFAKLAAQKLTPDGHAAIMLGQQNSFEIEAILHQYLKKRWVLCYLHASGAGTPARKAGIASHWRPVLIMQRKDAPERPGLYREFVHDIVPRIPKFFNIDDGTLDLLYQERNVIDRRIAELEAGENDPFVDDLIVTLVRRSELLKRWHPWAQHVGAFQEIIRRFSRPSDLVWEPFAGSGTSAIAAVTCNDRHLKNGKWVYAPAPRRGIGCDAMEMWARVAKFRIWDAQHPGITTDPSSGDEFTAEAA